MPRNFATLEPLELQLSFIRRERFKNASAFSNTGQISDQIPPIVCLLSLMFEVTVENHYCRVPFEWLIANI